MDQIKALDRIMKPRNIDQRSKGSDVSAELREVIDKTRANIRAAFGDGKPAKASVRK